MSDINIKITTKGDVPRVSVPRPPKQAAKRKAQELPSSKFRITPADVDRMKDYCQLLEEIIKTAKISDAAKDNLSLFALGVRDALADIEDLHEEMQLGSQLLFEATVLLTVLAKDPTNKDVLNSARGWLQGFSPA